MSNGQHTTWWTGERIALVSGGGVLVALVAWSLTVVKIGGVSFASNEFGDSLAPVAGVFAGIALILAALAVYLQREELREQRRVTQEEGQLHRQELEQHRKELAASREAMERQARAMEESVQSQRGLVDIYSKLAAGTIKAADLEEARQKAEGIAAERGEVAYWMDTGRALVAYLRPQYTDVKATLIMSEVARRNQMKADVAAILSRVNDLQQVHEQMGTDKDDRQLRFKYSNAVQITRTTMNRYLDFAPPSRSH